VASEQGRKPIRREFLTWEDVEKLLDVLLGQLRQAGPFDAMIMITRGGIVPGGMIGETLDIKNILTAAVHFPTGLETTSLAAWPEFLQFPEDALLAGRRTLVVDDVWGSGRTMAAVTGRVEVANGRPATCVFHFNPYRSLFSRARPDYYGAVTDAYIIYPWEVDRGLEGLAPTPPSVG
jgi:hypoxanthine phosphoribosyltransferase